MRPNTVEYLLTPLRSDSNADQFITAALEAEVGTERAEGDERAPQETRWNELLDVLTLSNGRMT